MLPPYFPRAESDRTGMKMVTPGLSGKSLLLWLYDIVEQCLKTWNMFIEPQPNLIKLCFREWITLANQLME
jgi:hypothetical protein